MPLLLSIILEVLAMAEMEKKKTNWKKEVKLLSVTDRTLGQKISKGNINPDNPINHLDLTYIYTTPHPRKQQQKITADRLCLDLLR